MEKFLVAQKGQIDGHRIFLESQHQAKPGEEQTLMTMFRWLDADVKRLDQEPKAQKMLDEAQQTIHEAVSETQCECLGQMHDTAAQTQKKLDDLACERKLTQAMVGSSSMPGGMMVLFWCPEILKSLKFQG